MNRGAFEASPFLFKAPSRILCYDRIGSCGAEFLAEPVPRFFVARVNLSHPRDDMYLAPFLKIRINIIPKNGMKEQDKKENKREGDKEASLKTHGCRMREGGE